ncbi:UNVERIFIED_CONTAM: hypothetical protein HDU68_008885 [Siphonaria sp. JEL0065]|nr:hypothetical protein HDU68_008885 [Siphonaria sp. JEL0065]
MSSSSSSSAFQSADSVSVDVLPSLLNAPAFRVTGSVRKAITLTVVDDDNGPVISWGSSNASTLAKKSSRASLLSSLSRQAPIDPQSVAARFVFALSFSNTAEVILHYLDIGGEKPTKAKEPVLKTVTFDFETVPARDAAVSALKNLDIATKDFDALNGIPQRKPIYMFVNPFGGVKDAVKIFDSTVVPMLEIAGIPFERKDTEFMGHAEQIMQTIDVTKYSAFIAVSGDGVLHEVINGMMSRRDWRVARTVPVGTIGAGSSNAMNANLAHHFPAYGVLSIIKQTTRPMDIISTTFHNSQKVVYSHLNLTWAYIADLDIESDQFRWIGREKTTLSALNRLIRLRKYRARIGILPLSEAPAYESDFHESEKLDAERVVGQIETCYGPKRHLAGLEVHDALFSKQVNPANEPVSYFTANNLPWISTTFKASSSAVKFGSGGVEVTYGGKQVSRWGMLNCLLNERVPDDVSTIGFECVQAKGFRLEPLGWAWGLADWAEGREEVDAGKLVKNVGGVLAISGEPFASEPVTVEVHPGVVNMISGSWLNEDE